MSTKEWRAVLAVIPSLLSGQALSAAKDLVRLPQRSKARAQDDRPVPSQARSREVFSPNVYGGRANAIDFRGNVSDFATHFFGIGKGIKGAL